MENITIGIVAKDIEKNKIVFQSVSKSNLKYLHNKCNFIGILNYNNDYINTEILSLCDAIIFQGGRDICPYHFQILEYAIKHHIPVLGICMGHQIIGLYSMGSSDEQDLIKIKNHNDKDKRHIINIKKNSFLNRALGNSLEVNTRHKCAIEKVLPPFKVSALSQDNIIEGIEYIDDNNFVLGVQFHPEDLDNTENLYNLFIKEIIKRKHN